VQFRYYIEGEARIEVGVFTVSGERVALIHETKNGGDGQNATTIWEASHVAPGIYLCKVVITDANGERVTRSIKKIALIK
jgi:5-hydroxyisourate hydrolase-like protein (transthyretin family)